MAWGVDDIDFDATEDFNANPVYHKIKIMTTKTAKMIPINDNLLNDIHSLTFFANVPKSVAIPFAAVVVEVKDEITEDTIPLSSVTKDIAK